MINISHLGSKRNRGRQPVSRLPRLPEPAYDASMRIIAGEARGRKLFAPEGRGTRPPLERIRESIFEVLGDLDGTDVLDLFAGAGAFGREAVSRGARSATFVERDRAALRALERNIRDLGFGGRTRVIRGDALSYPCTGDPNDGGEGAPGFDLIFLDPPFACFEKPDEARRVLERVGALVASPLRPGGRLLLRHPSKIEVSPPLQAADRRMYGESVVLIFLKGAS
jgi:16S rRNA (guanine966-N2)-methyltransferase